MKTKKLTCEEIQKMLVHYTINILYYYKKNSTDFFDNLNIDNRKFFCELSYNLIFEKIPNLSIFYTKNQKKLHKDLFEDSKEDSYINDEILSSIFFIAHKFLRDSEKFNNLEDSEQMYIISYFNPIEHISKQDIQNILNKLK